MQFRKILALIAWLCCLLPWLNPAFCQVIRENDKGEKIIVYPDGSWQYFSAYSDPEQQGAATGNSSSNLNGDDSYPIFQGTIEPLDGSLTLTQEDIFKISVRRAQLAKEASNIAEVRAQKARTEREELELELQLAQQSVDYDADLLKQLNLRFEAAKRIESETAREARQALQEAQKAEEITEKGGYVEEFNFSQRQKKSQIVKTNAQTQQALTSYENIIPLQDNFEGLPDRDNILINPPEKECVYSYDGVDEKSGQYRKDVQKQLLFTHTDDRLRLFLKEKEYLKCEGYFTALGGGFRFLTLQFTFAYPNAREAYGFIEKGSVLMIKLLNNDYVSLRSGKMDRGSYDTEKELLTYRVHYPIDRTQLNLLKLSEVDNIKVFWSTGFEEYDVFQLDFFINQIGCLEN